jgi:arginase family enzyme
MQNWKNYFLPCNINDDDYSYLNRRQELFFNIDKYTAKNDEVFSNINKYDLALIGIPEDRNSNNKGSAKAPSIVRDSFYKLYKPVSELKIADLGDLQQGKTVRDTYFAVKDIITELLEMNVIPLIIGGTQDLTYPIYLAYEQFVENLNIVTIDSRFDLGNTVEDFDSQSFLNKIILNEENCLFNLTNIGYQSYYVSLEEIELINELYFDAIRVGIARSEISENEPYLRDADFVSLDISSVKKADAPGHAHPSVNGFYGEEICKLAKYAGLSDRLSAFGIFEINPDYDNNRQTTELAAQILWYFIQGFSMRKKEYPLADIQIFKKYMVSIEGPEHRIIFYRSPKTHRMWMEIPYLDKRKEKTIIVSCSYDDYQKAVKNEIPNRWWKYYQKLN